MVRINSLYKSIILTFILSCTITTFLQIIGQIFTVDRGTSLNTLVRGELLNLGLPKLNAKKLETSIYRRCKKVFDILNHLGLDRAVVPVSHPVLPRKLLTTSYMSKSDVKVGLRLSPLKSLLGLLNGYRLTGFRF